MNIRFSFLVILASSYFVTACTPEKDLARNVAVPGYPAPRSIKQLQEEDSWKQRADEMIASRASEESSPVVAAAAPVAAQPVVAAKTFKGKANWIVRVPSKNHPRKISSQKNSKLK